MRQLRRRVLARVFRHPVELLKGYIDPVVLGVLQKQAIAVLVIDLDGLQPEVFGDAVLGVDDKISHSQVGIVGDSYPFLELLAAHAAVVAAEDLVVGEDGETVFLADETALEVGHLEARFELDLGFLHDQLGQPRGLSRRIGGYEIAQPERFVLGHGLTQQIQARSQGRVLATAKIDYVALAPPERDLVELGERCRPVEEGRR